MIDRRIKGCSNENCEQHNKKIKYKASDSYCLKCGQPLMFVCAKCLAQIEDIDPKHRYCRLCEAKKEDRKNKVIDGAKNAGGKAVKTAGGIVIGVAAGVATKLVKDGKTKAIDVGVDLAKNTAKAIFKK